MGVKLPPPLSWGLVEILVGVTKRPSLRSSTSVEGAPTSGSSSVSPYRFINA